jgi:hypothetical protein
MTLVDRMLGGYPEKLTRRQKRDLKKFHEVMGRITTPIADRAARQLQRDIADAVARASKKRARRSRRSSRG